MVKLAGDDIRKREPQSPAHLGRGNKKLAK